MKPEFNAELLTPIDFEQAGRYINNNQYGMQPKFDGVRRSYDISEEGAFGFNKLGGLKMLEPLFREEFRRNGLTDIHVDGELIDNNGLVLFDILRLDGHDLSKIPYVDRWQILHEMADGFSPSLITVSPLWIGGDKERHFIEEYDNKAEGVVFKKLSAPYRPGRNGQHFKVKFVATATMRVGQKDRKDEGKLSIALEMRQDGKWIRVGHASLIGKGAVPPVGSFVECRYLYAVKSPNKIGLVQTVYLMTRDDVTDADCDISQLKFRRRLGKGK